MTKTYLNAFQIGVVAGMRSMMAPALVSYKLSQHRIRSMDKSKLKFMTSTTTKNIFDWMAGGELVGDKLSETSRIGQPQIYGRVATGALSGAALTEGDRETATYGALLGVAGAVAGSFAFYHLRRWLTEEKNLPDGVVAIGEDLLAIGLGWLAINKGKFDRQPWWRFGR